MSKNNYELILFDAANTLIHKPALWDNILNVLRDYNILIDKTELRKKHKLISEIIHFPDRTSPDFYKNFNNELMLSLGIIPSEKLLDDIFDSCTYLPWEAFDDTKYIKEIDIPKAILSNFNSSLKDHVEAVFGKNIFSTIIGSEKEGVGKPSLKFYERALTILNIDPAKIIYIGDSLKLDIIPASKVGIDSWLIDRDNNFTYFDKRINSLQELKNII
jgi:putative hydrolase of the HAD superfamily